MNSPHVFQRNGGCTQISHLSSDNKGSPFEEDNEGREFQIRNLLFCKVKDGGQTLVHMYMKDSHKLWSTMIVFLGILDFSNGEGGSSVGEGHSSAGEGGSSIGGW